MPNHVTNIVKAPPEVLAFLKGPKSSVDFNTIIPMAPELQSTTCEGRCETLAKLLTGGIDLDPKPGDMLGRLQLSNAVRTLKENAMDGLKSDEHFGTFIQMLRNYRNHGALTWYDWSSEHWGTKWNAYDVAEGEGEVRFDTAWSPPHPIISRLAMQFPDAVVEHLWASEDTGSELGRRTYRGPAFEEAEIADKIDFALTVTGHDREYYRQNPESGMWEYFDKDDETTDDSVEES